MAVPVSVYRPRAGEAVVIGRNPQRFARHTSVTRSLLSSRCARVAELIRGSMATRRLHLSEAEDAARVHRASFDDRLPWLTGLHTPDEDRAYFADVVFDECEVWGSFEGRKLIGLIAFRENWIDQLYVLPGYQGRGIGSALLALGQARFCELQLWTFQKNEAARSFYERKGFVVAEQTDGSRKEEHEPDVRYVWRRE